MHEKTKLLEEIFSKNKSEKEIYLEIIAFSKRAKLYPKEKILKDNLVPGCQSELYLTHLYKDGKIEFFTQTDALISKGLSTIVTFLYSNEDPKMIFIHPPTILNELKIFEKISMNRQIGLASLIKEMSLICSKYI